MICPDKYGSTFQKKLFVNIGKLEKQVNVDSI